MLPNGFLGTRADILMDLVIVSFVVILPAMVWSWKQARARNYGHHKKAQITLFSVLFVAVALFEADLKMSGGIFELTAESTYADTALLNWIIYVHTFFAIVSALVWLVLVTWSLKRFDKSPKPNDFSHIHRAMGKTGMVTMMLSGLTAFPLYVLGFGF